MKAYNEYYDSHSVSEELQNKTMSRLNDAMSEKYEFTPYNRQKRRSINSIPTFARAACVIVLVCVVLTATAYAVVSLVTWKPAENADPGGSFVVEPIEEAEYDSYLESSGVTTLATIYRHNFLTQPIVDERTMQIINEYLKDRVFTADGKAFELFVPIPGGFQADDRGYALYDEDGRVIGDISYTRIGADIPSGILILPKEVVVEWFEFSDTYDAAATFLGKDFRLPTVFTDESGPPSFRINGDEDFAEIFGRRAVYVSLDGDPGMYFFVETNRRAEDDAWIWYAPDAVVTEGEVAGVTIYKISKEDVNRYTWTLDGLTYMFFQFKSDPINDNCFTDEQCEDIIRSMIE